MLNVILMHLILKTLFEFRIFYKYLLRLQSNLKRDLYSKKL